MSFLEDCEKYFGSKDLYEVLGVEKSAKDGDIKKAYRKKSLKHHPDRFHDATEDQKQELTKQFQLLSKVHYILTDSEKRSAYDEAGVILNEDGLDGEADWEQYWRLLFPKITEKDVTSFLKKYVDSQEEREDLKNIYVRFDGDMDKIYESMIGFDEERTRAMLEEMIDSGEVPDFEAFSKESKVKQQKRKKRVQKEAKMAEKQKKSIDEKSIVSAIQSKNKNTFDNMISKLEAKYGNQSLNESTKRTKTRGTASKKRKN